MLKGNIGEWSEFYVFLKLLAEKSLDAADENLEKLPGISYPILEILRQETGGDVNYEFIEDEKIKITHIGAEVTVAEGSDLGEKAKLVLEAIKNSPETTFAIPIADELMLRLHVNRLSASGGNKEDLMLKIHDSVTRTQLDIGFSIKSMLGSPSTLLNASAATNFVYKISGLVNSEVDRINAIDTTSKIRDRLAAITAAGGKLSYSEVDSAVFKENLKMIDTIFPEIAARLLLDYFSGNGSTLEGLIKAVGNSKIDVFGFELKAEAYEFKVKNFLYNVALGMVPGTAWDGLLRAHGGYIIVRKDGEILCYHVNNADEFRSYLFKNTRLETPSSSRHNFGTIYEKDGELFIKLNLQIRFTQ
jgi:type II restriction enzyme